MSEYSGSHAAGSAKLIAQAVEENSYCNEVEIRDDKLSTVNVGKGLVFGRKKLSTHLEEIGERNDGQTHTDIAAVSRVTCMHGLSS